MGYNMSGKLTRAEAFRFACWALAQERAAQQVHRRSYNPERRPYRETVYMTALREFMQAYPVGQGDATAPIYWRLRRRPDRAVLAGFFRRLTQRGREGDSAFAEADAQKWWRVYWTWLEIARARANPEPPPRPMRVDLLESGTPAQALEAFARIPEGRAPERGSAEEALIAAGINFWIRAFEDTHGTRSEREPRDCACDTRMIHPFRPEDHIARCPRHAAWQRVAQLQTALRLAGAAGVPGPDLAKLFANRGPGQHTPWLTRRDDALEPLADWLDGKEKTGRGDQSPRRVVEALLREALRQAHPEAVPCPFCAGAVGMEKLEPHLWACASHPARVALRELEAAFAAQVGQAAGSVLVDAEEQEAVRQGLQELVAACERFNSDQGWDGERAYSEAWCERPWLAAVERAAQIAEPLRQAPANPNRRTAQLATMLIALVDSCRSYWRAAGDGGDRSLMDERQDELWRRTTERAMAVLAEPPTR